MTHVENICTTAGSPTPSAMPKAIREKKSVLTEDAKIGVKKVIKDQNKTAKVKTFFPPNLLEQLPPIIWLEKYPMGKADKIQPCSCIFHLNSGAICKTAIGMIALSAAFIKLENEHSATVLDVLINIAR
jgi:hypothetical protein